MQSPVSVQVQLDPMVTTALSETAAPPSALSTMLIVKPGEAAAVLERQVQRRDRVDEDIASSCLRVGGEPDLRAVAAGVPQPCDAELPTTRSRYPSGSSF